MQFSLFWFLYLIEFTLKIVCLNAHNFKKVNHLYFNMQINFLKLIVFFKIDCIFHSLCGVDD